MPAIGNIVVADATPTNHTFEPMTASMALSTWRASDNTTQDGKSRLTMAMSAASSARRTEKDTISLVVPIEGTVDGVVQVVRTLYSDTKFTIPVDATDADRAKFYALHKNLMAHATVQSYVQDGKCVY